VVRQRGISAHVWSGAYERCERCTMGGNGHRPAPPTLRRDIRPVGLGHRWAVAESRPMAFGALFPKTVALL
jgi:hypothetical protein